MHEMALCESIRRIIEDQAQAQAFERVERVTLEVGPFAGVEIEALRFGFDVAMAGSPAAAAKLDIIVQEGRGWCLPCGQDVAIAQRFDACPNCGSHQVHVTAGEALRIRELEVV